MRWPIILAELKARGFRIVHIVPASAERPATVTAAADWRPGSQPNLPPPVILIAEGCRTRRRTHCAKDRDVKLCLAEPADA